MIQPRTRVISPKVTEAAPRRWSNMLKVGDIAYTSGLTSRAPDGVTILGKDEYEQAKVVFQKIEALVTEAGGVMNDVVKLTIFVTNMARNTEVWRAREEFFSGDFPACSLVQVAALATPEILLEIEAVAHIGCSTAGKV